MSSLVRKLQHLSRTLVASTALLAILFPITTFSQVGGVASRQQPAPATTQQQNPTGQNSITQVIPLSPEVSPQRVGVTPGEVQSLALQDGIAMALQNNLD